jgi:hypothetical protein
MLDEDGGLGLDMWKGSRRATVERLLPLLPAVNRSAAMQSLMRRLLLTSAVVPEGSSGTPSLVHLRIGRLAAAGASDAVVRLARVTPSALQDDLLARVVTDAHWLLGEDGEGCARSLRMLRGSDDLYWLAASILCHARGGEKDQSALALSLWREQVNDNPVFNALAEALHGGDGALDALPAPSALEVAFWRYLKKSPPLAAMEKAGDKIPGVLAALARDPEMNIDLRLLAGERAEALGALSAMQLASLYASVPFTDAERADAAALAGTPRAGAYYYQAAAAQASPLGKAEALRQAWRLGRDRGLYATACRVNQAAARQLVPSPDLLHVAADAVRAAVAADDLAAARAWRLLLRERPGVADAGAAQALAQIWPLLQLGDAEAQPWDNAAFDAWLETQGAVDAVTRSRRAAMILAMAEALGADGPRQRIEDHFGVAPAADAATPPPGTLQGMKHAAAQNRRGETVLLALLALGPGGPATATADTLSEVVAALRAVRLEKDARRLALEAALARGV